MDGRVYTDNTDIYIYGWVDAEGWQDEWERRDGRELEDWGDS